MAPLVLHYLNNSRSQRLLWLLEELGVEYTVKLYKRDRETLLAPPELKTVHPLGKAPIVTDGDRVLVESGAIIEYLIDEYGAKTGLRPEVPGSPELLQYRYWLHAAEGSFMGTLLLRLVFDELVKKAPFFIKPIMGAVDKKISSLLITPNLRSQFDFIEGHLAKNHYFAGEEFTGCDVQMSFVVETGSTGRANEFVGVKTREWLKRMQARPAYITALEKGDEYEYATKA